MKALPEAFCERMKQQLKEEYPDFIKSYENSPSYGLRVNPLKGNPATIAAGLPFVMTPVSWCQEGYQLDPAQKPGKHPLHEAGVYYIQEPSAMSVISILDPQPGDIVLDLCAAPGGKSTAIAGRLQGQGLLVCNEYVPNRAKILSQNIERMGIHNALVLNEDPNHLQDYFPCFFDKIVVDAPCSGEGMFRKDEGAIHEWSPELVSMCAKRQEMILSCAHNMLRPGGILVYSTCTFSPQEDEEQIASFLEQHPEYELISSKRLWPHQEQGEGHYVAKLLYTGSQSLSHSSLDTPVFTYKNEKSKQKKTNSKKNPSESFEEVFSFCKESLQPEGLSLSQNRLIYFGNECYLIPDIYLGKQKGIKILRYGLHLGTKKKNRFEPAHALAKALCPAKVLQTFECDEEQAKKYLHGETLSTDAPKNGWTLICFQGYSLGWAKAVNGTLKNHYPKGLRTQY